YWSIILLYIAAQVLSVVIPLAIFATTGIRDASMVVYVNVTVFLLAVVGSFLILKRDLQEERLSHPLPVGKIIGWTALGIVLAWGAQLIAITIETNLLGISEGSENTESIIDITRMNPLFFIIPVFTAPILEELIFRKIIFGSLYKRMNFFLAVLISSFLFVIWICDTTIVACNVTYIYVYGVELISRYCTNTILTAYLTCC